MIKVPSQAQTGQIETSLCGCLSDCDMCIQATFCGCCLAPRLWAEIRGEMCGYCHCVAPASQVWTSTNIRHARGMHEDFCSDCMAHCFCQCCALARNGIEIKKLKNFQIQATDSQQVVVVQQMAPQA